MGKQLTLVVNCVTSILLSFELLFQSWFFANGDWAVVSLILLYIIVYILLISIMCICAYVHLFILSEILHWKMCVSIFCRVSCIPLSFLYGFDLHAFLYGNKVKQNKAFPYKLVAT